MEGDGISVREGQLLFAVRPPLAFSWGWRLHCRDLAMGLHSARWLRARSRLLSLHSLLWTCSGLLLHISLFYHILEAQFPVFSKVEDHSGNKILHWTQRERVQQPLTHSEDSWAVGCWETSSARTLFVTFLFVCLFCHIWCTYSQHSWIHAIGCHWLESRKNMRSWQVVRAC